MSHLHHPIILDGPSTPLTESEARMAALLNLLALVQKHVAKHQSEVVAYLESQIDAVAAQVCSPHLVLGGIAWAKGVGTGVVVKLDATHVTLDMFALFPGEKTMRPSGRREQMFRHKTIACATVWLKDGTLAC